MSLTLRGLSFRWRAARPLRRSRERRPAVEGLEQRSLLSAGVAHHPQHHHAKVHVRDEPPGQFNSYQRTNLVSDLPGVAQFQDTNLVNAWGVAFSSTSPFWVSDNGTGVSTLYNFSSSPIKKVALTVTIPVPPGGTPPSAPTGMVFNSTTSDFFVSQGGKTGKSIFVFATEEGTIAGWSPAVDGTHAILAVDNSASDAIYKGLALGSTGGANFLYATNFHAGTVDVFDTHFQAVPGLSSKFHDAKIPSSYAPFGIENIGGKLYVTFAKQDANKEDDVSGQGHGFVDVFSTDGTLLRRLVRHGQLNSPWGLAIAPSNFGAFSGDLLVGNFGNGRINAYDAETGEYRGRLKDPFGKPIVVDGLWALKFGNGAAAGPKDVLFFSAGPNDESHGLFGSLQAVPRVRGDSD